MPIVSANGIEIYYETAGSPDAPPLLLIQGLSGYTEGWLMQVPALKEDFYVIYFDNRGAGKSTQSEPGYMMVDMADDTAALLDTLEIPQAYVLGVSMGGMIALNLAMQHPQKVNKLALGCTTAGGASAVWADEKVSAALITPSSGDLRQDFYDSAWFLLAPDTIENNSRLVEQLAENAGNNPQTPTGFMGQLQAISTHDVAGALPELSMPTLVMHGDLDLLIPLQNGRFLAEQIPHAEFKNYPNTGHLFFVEQAVPVNDDLREFFLRS
uniref:Esterase n=1 Tax=uncultured prokaryote TaxID=198431 RepID=A2T3U9_9ZZZZ|nr:esterase [uncultured prokaryote]